MRITSLSSRATSKTKQGKWLLAGIWLLCSTSLASAQDTDFPTLPSAAVDRYSVTQIEERIESLDMPQLRAAGGLLVFKMDPVSDHSVVRAPEGVSLRLQHYANPGLKVDLSSFKAEDFGYDLNEPTLRSYLQGLSQGMTEEQDFEVLEEPVISTGPARFRFLGQRAIPLRYRFIDGGNDVTRAENWFQIGDNIHVIAIEGPSRFFDSYFESIRVPFNSSVEVSD